MKRYPPVIKPPPQRKRKLETPVCSPPSPIDEESSSDVKLRSVLSDPVYKPPQQKRKLETLVYSPPSPIDEESSSDVKLRSVLLDLVNKQQKRKLETSVYSPPSPIDEESSSNLKHVRDSVGNKPYCGVKAIGCSPADELIAKVGLHCYNSHKGTNLRFMTVTKLMIRKVAGFDYDMTLDALDPDNNSFSSIQTCVWDATPKIDANLILVTSYCSLEGSREGGSLWDPNGVDVLYKGVMPKWLDDGALTRSEKLQYYELNGSDLLENDWLHLYAEVGAYAKWNVDMVRKKSLEEVDHLSLEIKKAVVQTKEDVESSLKLKSSNAIFYITFKTRGGVECRCIIRQTSDGRPQHMCLEVKMM